MNPKHFSNQPANDAKKIFLSIIVRTRGDRNLELLQAFRSIELQDSRDFEIILAVHNEIIPPETHNVLNKQPVWLKTKIRTIQVSGGKRAKPLNQALNLISGKYVAFLDDDDLVLPNWVKVFQSLNNGSPALLRAVAVSRTRSSDDLPIFSLPSDLEVQTFESYPEKFVFLDHLRVNQSPLMSLAFPEIFFRKSNYCFDEDLEVLEDWDLVLHASSTLPLAETPQVTCIYQRWIERSSSQTEHSQDQWRESEQKVIEKFRKNFLKIPGNEIDQLRESLWCLDNQDHYLAVEQELRAIKQSKIWRATQPIRYLVTRIKRCR